MDDVSYLKKHGTEESYMFIVDSARRDTSAYPNPNAYTIAFDAPFRNVTSLELLDATVPRTEYTVESSMNTFAYSVNGGAPKSLSVTPGDYNLLELSQTISDGLTDGLACEPESTPYTRTSRTRFYCDSPFALDMTVPNSIRRVIGFSGTQKTFASTYSGESTQPTFNGPFPGFQSTRCTSSARVRQAFVPTASGRVSAIVVHASAGSSALSAEIVDATGTSFGSADIAPGTSDQTDLGTSGGNVVAGRTYYLVMESSGADVYVNEPPDAVSPAEVSADGGDTWTGIAEGLAACVEIQVAVGRHEIVSPGLVDLTGERYVVVRCPDVETLMHRERAYEQYHAGLGMVKLGELGYKEQRFDFVSLPTIKIPNPIGKLSSLSFRLEKSGGRLYDARGIDHVLVLKISYYSGIARTEEPSHAETRQLNPRYTPHVNEYLENYAWSREDRARDTDAAWK
jgi:hypothetical protein